MAFSRDAYGGCITAVAFSRQIRLVNSPETERLRRLRVSRIHEDLDSVTPGLLVPNVHYNTYVATALHTMSAAITVESHPCRNALKRVLVVITQHGNHLDTPGMFFSESVHTPACPGRVLGI